MAYFPLLSLNPRQRTTRDLIFSILASRFPLKLIELHRVLTSHTKLKITYQGVRRAVTLMKRDGVVLESQGALRLNPAWLEAAKTTIDFAHEVSRGSSSRPFSASDLTREHYRFSCNSLYEADVVWGDLLFAFVASEISNGPIELLSLNHSAWAFLFNTGREVDLFRRLEELGAHSTMVFSADNLLNRGALKLYRQVGCEAYIDQHLAMPIERTWNVSGDFVIQVEIDQRIARELLSLVNGYGSRSHEMHYAALASRKGAGQKGVVHFHLQRNAALAAQLRSLVSPPRRSAQKPSTRCRSRERQSGKRLR